LVDVNVLRLAEQVLRRHNGMRKHIPLVFVLASDDQCVIATLDATGLKATPDATMIMAMPAKALMR
jgi:hypothetical protein